MAAAPLPSTRKKARHLLVQALYQWQLAQEDIAAIEAQFYADHSMARVDTQFFGELLHGIPANLADVDAAYEQFLDRKMESLDPVSRAVLRLGTYELMYRIDVPYKVAINESVNLAKTFGPSEAHKYINGILDKVAGITRRVELSAGRARG